MPGLVSGLLTLAQGVQNIHLLFPDTYSVGAIKFDLILAESHSFENSVTSHALQDGTVISDHIYNKLQTGTLKGMVSNYSIIKNFGILTGVFNETSLMSLSNPFGIPNKMKNTYDAFKKLWQSRELVTIVTMLQSYTDVAITSINIDRDGDSGHSQTFEVSFQQIKKVVFQKDLSQFVGPNVPNTTLTDVQKQAATKAAVAKTAVAEKVTVDWATATNGNTVDTPVVETSNRNWWE